MVVNMELRLPDGSAIVLSALYDNGAEINLIGQVVVERLGLACEMHAIWKPTAHFLNKHEMPLWDGNSLTVTTKDSAGTPHTIGPPEILGSWFCRVRPCPRMGLALRS
jgi:hypothetical protein